MTASIWRNGMARSADLIWLDCPSLCCVAISSKLQTQEEFKTTSQGPLMVWGLHCLFYLSNVSSLPDFLQSQGSHYSSTLVCQWSALITDLSPSISPIVPLLFSFHVIPLIGISIKSLLNKYECSSSGTVGNSWETCTASKHEEPWKKKPL